MWLSLTRGIGIVATLTGMEQPDLQLQFDYVSV